MLNSVGLHQTVSESLKWIFDGPFNAFVVSHPRWNWAVVSDYVIGDTSARNDALAFTVLPIRDQAFSGSGFKSFTPTDLKKVKVVSQSALSYMRNGDHFTFCFAVEKGRHKRTSSASIKRALAATRVQAENWRRTEARDEFLKKLRRVEQDLNANGFRRDIFEDGCLVSNIAALLAFNTIKSSNADKIIWIPDRDTMTESSNGFFFDAYNASFHGLCQNNGIPSDHILVGIGVHDSKSAPGTKPWYDDLVRLPDYHVGALARWDFLSDPIDKEKHRQIVAEVFAGNEHVCLAYLAFPFYGPTCSLIHINYAEGPKHVAQQRRIAEHLLNMVLTELCRPLDETPRGIRHVLLASSGLTTFGKRTADTAFRPARSFPLPVSS